MTLRSVRTQMARLCLVTCLISGLAQERGLVFCFGMDGHFDVSPEGDRCAVCADESHPPAAGPCAGEVALGTSGPCCPCIDVSVESSGGIARQDRHRFSLRLAVALAATPPPFPSKPPRLNPATSTTLPTWLPATSFPLAQLRSVVLLV